MADNELPWFKFWVREFLAITRHMTNKECGAYILLLMEEWEVGFLPQNKKKLMRISRSNESILTSILVHFELNLDGNYFSGWLEKRREERMSDVITYSNRGKKGAEAKWSSNAQAMLKHDFSHRLSEERGIYKEKNIKKESRLEEPESSSSETLPELELSTLVGSMLSEWHLSFPTYPLSEKEDFAAARRLAAFIARQAGLTLDYQNPESILVHWRKWFRPIREHPTWAGKSLTAIEKFHKIEVLKQITESNSQDEQPRRTARDYESVADRLRREQYERDGTL